MGLNGDGLTTCEPGTLLIKQIVDRWDGITGFCCASCRHYGPKDYNIGRCRRRAPTDNGYPVVYPTDCGCGDHKVGTNPLKESFYA